MSSATTASPYRRALVVLLLGVRAAPAEAQGYVYEPAGPAAPTVRWFLDSGASLTEGAAANLFGTGWTAGTGLSIRPDPSSGLLLRPELDYSRFEVTSQFLGPGPNNGNMQTVTGYLNAALDTPVGSWLRLYATGGIGAGWRRIELTPNSAYCSAFLCGGSGSGASSSDTTKFAWDAGVGMDFMLPSGQAWFLEARWERIETQQPTELLPIRFGFRF
jgi:outer membrane protein with beta-barrel domain